MSTLNYTNNTPFLPSTSTIYSDLSVSLSSSPPTPGEYVYVSNNVNKTVSNLTNIISSNPATTLCTEFINLYKSNDPQIKSRIIDDLIINFPTKTINAIPSLETTEFTTYIQNYSTSLTSEIIKPDYKFIIGDTVYLTIQLQVLDPAGTSMLGEPYYLSLWYTVI